MFSRLASRFLIVEGCTGVAGNLFTEVVNGVDTLAVLRCMGFVGSGPVNEVGCTLGWFHRRIGGIFSFLGIVCSRWFSGK